MACSSEVQSKADAEIQQARNTTGRSRLSFFHTFVQNNQFSASYLSQGYAVAPKLVSPSEISLLLADCANITNKAGVEVMCEKDSDVVRRVERIYDKTPAFVELNLKLMAFLAEQFQVPFVLFKDKINFKAPGAPGFRPHYDGVFSWKDLDGQEQQGWFYYANEFFNVLVALDECTVDNGTIEIAPVVLYDNFEEYVDDTVKEPLDPYLKPEIAGNMQFEPIIMKPGDVVVFSSRCPHRSGTNTTNKHRRLMYYTYNLASDGEHRQQYFNDKFELNKEQPKALQ